jgi:hypothetical protein
MERNMYEKINLLKCVSAILFFFILGLASISAAGDCGDCKEPPTFPGNASRCQCAAVPTIVAKYADTSNADKETIGPGRPVTLSANGGCPPYTWSTSSAGYSLSTDKTYNDGDTVTLTNTSTTSCGSTYNIVATVTVTDSCPTPKSNTIEIRNAQGRWGSSISVCGYAGGDRYTHIVGSRNYRVWIYTYGGFSTNCDGEEADGYNYCIGGDAPCAYILSDDNYMDGYPYKLTGCFKGSGVCAPKVEGSTILRRILGAGYWEWTCP